MKRSKVGPLDVWFAGGTDGDGGGDGPAIVLCHGFGAGGDDLVSLWRAVDVGRGVRWFFPEAPISLAHLFGGPARAWWLIDMAKLDAAMRAGRIRELKSETPEGLAEARAALEDTLFTLGKEHGLDRARTIVGGFSQGAMLTTEIALHAEAPFAGLAVLSGTFLSETRWREAAKTSGPKLHVAQSHGRRDPILPFGLAEELSAMLTEHGASVDFVAHGGAHEIPAAALDGLARLAAARFAP